MAKMFKNRTPAEMIAAANVSKPTPGAKLEKELDPKKEKKKKKAKKESFYQKFDKNR